MNFLDKMERKYGRYALSHLTMYIIVTYIAGYIIALAAPIMRQYLTLEPYYILHGQIWRLVSWILIPPLLTSRSQTCAQTLDALFPAEPGLTRVLLGHGCAQGREFGLCCAAGTAEIGGPR